MKTASPSGLIRLDPPGTWCMNYALWSVLKHERADGFLEIGCGAGALAKELCRRGLSGIGVDASAQAIEIARNELHEYLESGAFTLLHEDIFTNDLPLKPAGVAISMMVVEHIEDDQAFVSRITNLVRPGGLVCIGVPGRPDCWGVEDETVGHVRRYDRSTLQHLLTRSGLVDVKVLSIAVPVSNLLFSLSNAAISSSGEVSKKSQPQQLQTALSGVREVPYKTVFPSWCRLLLNRYAMYPFCLIQRLFYRTDLGLTLLGFGRRPISGA